MNAKAIYNLNVGVSSKLEEFLSPVAGQQLRIYSARLLNVSGATVSGGLFARINQEQRKIYELLSGVATDVTSTVDGGSNINLCTTSSGSGIIVTANRKFHALAITGTLAQTGSPTITVSYYNGSSFVAVPSTVEVMTSYGASVNLVVFSAPNGWETGDGGAYGLDSDQYALIVSVASSGNTPTSNDIQAYYCIDFQTNIANNAALSINFSENYPHHLLSGETVASYFSTASANNRVTTFYTIEN